jgi:response regulator RpfG family c-di-GMP phosphodiesterase
MMATPHFGARSDQSRPAILVVDDEPAITRTLARSLRDRFQVFTANTADVALDVIAREEIAVILTDQRMPDLSGVQLLERARDLRPTALGILISGYTDASALVDALNLGNVRGFLPKPWDVHQLRRQLDQVLRTYQAGFQEAQAYGDNDDALTRARSQVNDLREALDQLNHAHTALLFERWERALRDARQGPERTPLPDGFTAGPPPSEPPLAQAAPETFSGLVAAYAEILDLAVTQRHQRVEIATADQVRSLGERLGTLWAGPRDLTEIHAVALHSRTTDAPAALVKAYADEGRLILAELMGDLLIFYRGWLAADLVRQTA